MRRSKNSAGGDHQPPVGRQAAAADRGTGDGLEALVRHGSVAGLSEEHQKD